jgi:predicted ribosomally synthesized peptide with SipW-like signal peptide
MNKKILLSLSTIAAVAAIAIGGTVAYFSDTETSTGNTFSAGTIDIAVDGKNPWSHDIKYDIKDLKPGESGNINLRVDNKGTNPVDITKRLFDFAGNGGTTEVACSTFGINSGHNGSSEPECEAEANGVDNDIQKNIKYTLSVEVYNGNNKIWWQEIYDSVALTSVYDGTKLVDLGMIPVGGYMLVNQNYELDYATTDNKYQGDGFTFNMELVGNQLSQANGYDTVALENKDGANDWQILSSDGIQGTLNYKTTGPRFEFNFSGKPAISGSYSLIYVGLSGNYPYDGTMVVLGTGSTDGSGNISISGNAATGSIANGKIWLVPSTSGWDQANTLFETALINYTQN